MHRPNSTQSGEYQDRTQHSKHQGACNSNRSLETGKKPLEAPFRLRLTPNQCPETMAGPSRSVSRYTDAPKSPLASSSVSLRRMYCEPAANCCGCHCLVSRLKCSPLAIVTVQAYEFVSAIAGRPAEAITAAAVNTNLRFRAGCLGRGGLAVTMRAIRPRAVRRRRLLASRGSWPSPPSGPCAFPADPHDGRPPRPRCRWHALGRVRRRGSGAPWSPPPNP